jgi:hypothetical protein
MPKSSLIMTRNRISWNHTLRPYIPDAVSYSFFRPGLLYWRSPVCQISLPPPLIENRNPLFYIEIDGARLITVLRGGIDGLSSPCSGESDLIHPVPGRKHDGAPVCPTTGCGTIVPGAWVPYSVSREDTSESCLLWHSRCEPGIGRTTG